MARPREHDGVVYKRNDSNIWWMRYRDRAGNRCLESTNTADWDEAQRALRDRLAARDNNSLDILRKGNQIVFDEWVEHFLEHYSKPPIRTKATHVANQAALRTLRPAFGTMKLADINSPMIEEHLRRRLGQRKVVHRKEGICELGIIKPTTVHQEFRVLRRIFAVAVKKRLVTINPCSTAEFPVRVKGLFRPHYMTWSEQTRIEAQAPEYLKNVIRIITETGLRVYKELAPMRKEQIDLSNKVVFIADSKTPTGIGEVPLTDIAVEAFRSQIELAGPGSFRATTIRPGTRRHSRRSGARHYGKPACGIFGFMICGLPMRHASLRAVWLMNG